MFRYLMSFVLDSTIGLLVIYLGLKIAQMIVHKYKCSSLKFGEYGKYFIFINLGWTKQFKWSASHDLIDNCVCNKNML